MSDLFPLVAEVLKDKASLDALEEIAKLKEKSDIGQSVEVIRSVQYYEEDKDRVVYASGLLKNGKFSVNHDNFGMFEVNFVNNNECPIIDLRDCQLCFGGGFPVGEQLGYSKGWSDWNEDDNSLLITIRFLPDDTILTLMLLGWPSDDYEAKIQSNELDPNNIVMDYLINMLAFEYPNAIVRFKNVSFREKKILGPLNRFLTLEEKRATMHEMEEFEMVEQIASFEANQYDALMLEVGTRMQEVGMTVDLEEFPMQVETIVNTLIRLSIQDSELINNIVDVYRTTGLDGLQAFEAEQRERIRELILRRNES